MINILSLIIFIIFFTSCSFHDSGGFWTKEKKLESSQNLFKPIFKKEEKKIIEFNKNFSLPLINSNIKVNKFSHLDNNNGFTKFNGKLKNYLLS